ncbi:hypothetical protein EDC01DRAFT_610185 [Geopyxis carbonaria]|nr:hypothetical protein EDC01DRAFT_610185 [Geopyxis carbonaria]
MPHLRLLAGASPNSLTPTPPNTSTSHPLSPSTSAAIYLKTFTGTPTAPSTHPLFTQPPHTSNHFSLRFTLTPPHDIAGDTLLLANTFDKPVRDALPYFFSAAWAALKLLDPGITGDVYADAPRIMSPALSSMTAIRVLAAGEPGTPLDEPIKEDFALAGVDGIPPDSDGRKKWFLDEKRRKEFVFRKGVRYEMEFANGVVDFDKFEVMLPGLGWRVGVLRYWDGQPWRYVLMQQEGGGKEEVLGVVQFEIEMEDDKKKEDAAADGQVD